MPTPTDFVTLGPWRENVEETVADNQARSPSVGANRKGNGVSPEWRLLSR